MRTSETRTLPVGAVEFPHTIDNTIISTYKGCPWKARTMYMEHWKPRLLSVHLVAGKAFAAGLEVLRKKFFWEGCSIEDSLAYAIAEATRVYGPDDYGNPNKSLLRVQQGLIYYTEEFPLDREHFPPVELAGEAGLEFSFALPIPDPRFENRPFEHPETGEPLLYTGRADQIVHHRDSPNILWVEDDKTTSRLGATWGNQWKLRAQFSGYCWAAHQHEFPVVGTLVRGIAFYKNGYGQQEVLSRRPQHMLDDWLRVTQDTLIRMLHDYDRGYAPRDLSETCQAYGGCPLIDACANSPRASRFLSVDFKRRQWDPVRGLEINIVDGPADG